MKNGKVYMKHNTLGDDVPIVLILRAMGTTSDQEIVQLVRVGQSNNAPASNTSIVRFIHSIHACFAEILCYWG